MPPAKTIVAGVVLTDNLDRHLLVQERKKTAYKLWNLPAGHVDEGESVQEAAVRETLEETGLLVELIASEPLYVFYNEPTKTQLNSFKAKTIGGKLKIQKSELLDARWFSFKEILRLDRQSNLRTPWVKESIERARR